jgi:peptide subunit release factor 1 (eRF1)
VVVVDRSGARFYRFWLGEVEEQQKERFALDTSEWRKKAAVPQHPVAGRSRGSMIDRFEQRVDAHYAQFFRDTAGRAHEWAAREKLTPIFLVGPNEAVEPVWNELPAKVQGKAALVKGDFSKLSLAELQVRLAPEIARWKRRHELGVVESLLGQANGARAVAGLDETLLKLQQGAARELIVARGLGGKLRQCAKCQWADRSVDPACPSCGGERRLVPLRAVIPELARRHGVPVEVVAEEAGTALHKRGGMGAWLR